ncbi:hypothetical protein BDW71DRAFT_67526 [Aspergillus fruticulosus]
MPACRNQGAHAATAVYSPCSTTGSLTTARRLSVGNPLAGGSGDCPSVILFLGSQKYVQCICMTAPAGWTQIRNSNLYGLGSGAAFRTSNFCEAATQPRRCR